MNLTFTENLYVTDTETTGLTAPIRPCSIAYIKLPDISNLLELGNLSNKDLVEFFKEYCKDETSGNVFYRLYNPGKAIHPQASAVNGIYDSDVKDQPSYKEFKFPVESGYLLIHNAEFDYPILFNGEEGQRFSPFEVSGWKPICSKEMAQNLITDSKHKLVNLFSYYFQEYYEEYAVNAHNALGDCIMTALVFIRLLQKSPVKDLEKLHKSWSYSSPERNILKSKDDNKEDLDITQPVWFGVHKGVSFNALPSDYINWCLNKFEPYSKAYKLCAEVKKQRGGK